MTSSGAMAITGMVLVLLGIVTSIRAEMADFPEASVLTVLAYVLLPSGALAIIAAAWTEAL